MSYKLKAFETIPVNIFLRKNRLDKVCGVHHCGYSLYSQYSFKPHINKLVSTTYIYIYICSQIHGHIHIHSYLNLFLLIYTYCYGFCYWLLLLWSLVCCNIDVGGNTLQWHWKQKVQPQLHLNSCVYVYVNKHKNAYLQI